MVVFEIPLYSEFRDDVKGKILKEIWDIWFKNIIKDGSFKNLYIKHDTIEDYLYEVLV